MKHGIYKDTRKQGNQELKFLASFLPAFLIILLLCTGCSIVACNRVFPKLTWYWDSDATACRKEHRQEREWQEQYNRTNQVHQ